MTARDLISDALKTIGALASGEPLRAEEGADGLTLLNGMLNAWQADRLTVENIARQVYPFVANQQAYHIGPSVGFDFSFPVRPSTVINAAVLINPGTASEVEIPIRQLDDDEWARTAIKPVTSSLPSAVYYNTTTPLGTLSYWPVPTDATVSAVLYLPSPLLLALTLDTVLVLPAGYEEAMRYNLALRCAPTWGRPIDQVTATMAQESLSRIKRANLSSDTLRCDAALLARGGVPWSIWTGGM
jgi:hypothetical protein